MNDPIVSPTYLVQDLAELSLFETADEMMNLTLSAKVLA
jgi:hypothetical protein